MTHCKYWFPSGFDDEEQTDFVIVGYVIITEIENEKDITQEAHQFSENCYEEALNYWNKYKNDKKYRWVSPIYKQNKKQWNCLWKRNYLKN